jgi:hypothetical protein
MRLAVKQDAAFRAGFLTDLGAVIYEGPRTAMDSEELCERAHMADFDRAMSGDKKEGSEG